MKKELFFGLFESLNRKIYNANKFRLMFFLLMSFGMMGQTITITQSTSGITATGYDSGAERIWTQNSVDFGAKAALAGTSPANIQMQANNGVLYNTTALPGRILSIVITNSSGTNTSILQCGNTSRLVNSTTGNYTINGGTIVGTASSTGWGTSDFTSTNYTYFAIKRGTGSANWSSIVITYAVAPCSGTPNPGNTLATTNPVVPGNTTVLSLQNATSGSGVTYQWQSSTTSASTGFANISGANSATYTATVTAKTWYQCIVTCSTLNGTSVPVEVNLTYCTPTYFTGPGANDRITNVTLGTLSNTSGASASPYYTFYNSVTIPNIQQSSTANVSVSFGNDPNQYAGLWIDFNQNGIFESSEGLVSTNAVASSYVFNISVPAGAALGNTRMRIRGGDDNALTLTQSCGASNSSFGETEDYIVNVIAPCSPPTNQATVFSSSAITQNSATIGWTRGNGTAGVLVLARAGSAVNSDPSNGTTYTANTAFGSGTQIGTGNFVVYNGTGTSVNLTNLLASTNYHFAIYEYNSVTNCYNLVKLTGNLTTLAPLATTYTWTGATSSAWGTATNWSPNGIPSSIDNIVISSSGTNGLVINSVQSVLGFTLNGTGNFTLNASGTLNILGNVTYGGTATASLNCSSQVTITSSALQTVPPLNYGNLDITGGNRIFPNGGTIGICSAFNVDPALYTYTVTGSTVNYFSATTGWGMSSFIYHNLTFSGTGGFSLGYSNTNNTINVLGNYLQTAGTVYLGENASSTATLNIDGNMTISGGVFDMNNIDGGKGTVNLKGDLFVNNTGKLDATVNTNALLVNTNFNFTGIGDGSSQATTQTIDVSFPDNQRNRRIKFNIKNGSYVQLAKDFDLGNKSVVTVETGGTLDFGFDGTTALNITGNGRTATGFNAQQNSYLKITSPQGITSTAGVIGNIRTEVPPVFNDIATFHYIGKANQITGSGLPTVTSGKKVIIEMDTDLLELTASSTTRFNATGILEIRRGTVIDNGTNFFADGTAVGETGNLTMTGGLYKYDDFVFTSNSSTYYPRLSGNYSLTGGTIELAAITNTNSKFQRLRGAKIYHNLKISGSSSNGGYKDVSNAITINNSLNITGTPIFDTNSKSVTGLANVTMDGGRWRISRLTTAQPELSGTYALTGGTMEFYGTTTNTNQKIKGGITYQNIDVNADAANTNYFISDEFYNASPSSSLVINGNLNVNSPAIFKISSTHSVTGLGNISINPGAGLLYGSEYGIKTSGTSTTDGAIRLAGTRTFSNQASYGFIGGQATMITGNGIPSTVENLFVIKTNATDEVTISNPNLSVRNKMILVNGNVVTGSNILELGTDVTNKGTLQYTSGFVKGIFKRWFAGTNSGNDSSLFPMATATDKNRFVKIEYTTAPSTGGNVTAELKTTAMGNAGITALAAIPAVGTCAGLNIASTDDSGYWTLTKDATLAGGNFTVTFTKEDNMNTTPVCEMSLLKRDATDWTIQGTHLQPTGSPTMATVSRSGLNSFKDFGFGSKRCTPNIWNGTIWSAGIPTISHNIIFEADFTTNANLMACECEIQSGKTLTILENHTLDIQGNLNNNGTLNIENNGSLVQHNDFAINTGNIVMKRNAQPMYRYDFSYWSSPLTLDSGYKLGDSNLATPSLSPATLFDKYFFWNATSQAWNTVAYGNEVMIPGKGYIVRAPQTYSTSPSVTAIYEATFVGKPGNGIVSASIIGTNNWNLIGNPYPSAVSVDLFLSDALNTSVVDGTIYLWTHNSPPSDAVSGSDTYNYTANDYASYNFTGGTSTADNANSEPNALVNTPNGFIAAGQSFFIKGTGGGNATFNNSMRSGANNNQFFRMASAENSSQNILEKHRIWLNISNMQGAFNQTLVGYVENATNDLDRGFDGELLGGNHVTLYSIIQEKNLAIQGRTLPFVVSDQVVLGYKATISGNFKISIDHLDGLFANQNIYLEDKTLNLIHDLKQSDYQFSSAIGTFDNRFVLRYDNVNLGTHEFATNQNDVIIVAKNKNIKVISLNENIESISIYDLLGRIIYTNKNVHAVNFSVSEITANQQALIVKIKLENGEKVDKKIIYN